ncbi:MAG: threonylcarbamoyl-AMP synthase [Clostridiales bacterium]|nr:threonylcarbamoyl-AMP synthase [Clostridiales bacterium]
MKTRIIHSPDERDLKDAAEIIRGGGLVVFPTETVYGLGGSALDPDAARRIYEAKGRPSDNPLIIHLPSVGEVRKYADPPGIYFDLAERFLPGPLTVVMPKKDIIPDTVSAGLPTVAVRIPSNPTASELCRLAGVPIAAPSANLSGRPSVTTIQAAIEDMDGRADMIIDGGESEIGLESTIISLVGDPVLLRPGAVTLEMLREVIPDIKIGGAVKEKYDGRAIAPGMKYRHYAPSMPVVLIDGGDEGFYDYISEKKAALAKEGKRCGVLCYDEDSGRVDAAQILSLGPRADEKTAAHRLFGLLRSFSGVDVVYGRLPSTEGLGLAVFNRLIKAAGFEVVRL